MAPTGTDIGLAAKLLQAGKLVAIPTETVYGLAGNALAADLVAEIFVAKNRPSFDPLIVHTHSFDAAAQYFTEIPEAAKQLAENFWPGPLTLLLPKSGSIPDIVTAGSPYVGMRVPKHAMTLELLRNLPFPLAAPSANPFGYISPTTPAHVQAQLGDKVSYILDGGPCEVGIESTIVGFEGGKRIVYRLGGIGLEQLKAVIGTIDEVRNSSSKPDAPGMLTVHYAPHVPLVLGSLEDLLPLYAGKAVGVLSFRKTSLKATHVEILSANGNVNEAARNIFAALRRLDAAELDVIVAELVPEEGLGRAVNDRLRRASAK